MILELKTDSTIRILGCDVENDMSGSDDVNDTCFAEEEVVSHHFINLEECLYDNL